MEKSTMLSAALVLALLLAVCSFGAAIFYYQDRASLQEQLDEALAKSAGNLKLPSPKVTLAPSAQAAENTADETASLNAYIDKLEAENNRLKSQLANAEPPQERGNRWGNRPRMNMEELRENNPEEYERITSRMNEMRQRIEDEVTKRNTYLEGIDTSRMTSAQRNTIQDFQALLSEAQEDMQNGGFPRNGMEIFAMRGAVQQTLFENLASQIGADSESFMTSVQEILDVTQLGMPQGVGGMPQGGRQFRGRFGGGRR